MCEKVVSHGLDVAIIGGSEATNGFKILFGGPACREDRERQRDLYSGHVCVCGGAEVGRGSD